MTGWDGPQRSGCPIILHARFFPVLKTNKQNPPSLYPSLSLPTAFSLSPPLPSRLLEGIIHSPGLCVFLSQSLLGHDHLHSLQTPPAPAPSPWFSSCAWSSFDTAIHPAAQVRKLSLVSLVLPHQQCIWDIPSPVILLPKCILTPSTLCHCHQPGLSPHHLSPGPPCWPHPQPPCSAPPLTDHTAARKAIQSKRAWSAPALRPPLISGALLCSLSGGRSKSLSHRKAPSRWFGSCHHLSAHLA